MPERWLGRSLIEARGCLKSSWEKQLGARKRLVDASRWLRRSLIEARGASEMAGKDIRKNIFRIVHF